MTKTDSGLRIPETKETSSQDGEDMEQVGEEARAAQVNAVRAHTQDITDTLDSAQCATWQKRRAINTPNLASVNYAVHTNMYQ